MFCCNVDLNAIDGLDKTNQVFQEPLGCYENDVESFAHCKDILSFISEKFPEIEILIFLSKRKEPNWNEDLDSFDKSSSKKEVENFVQENSDKVICLWKISTHTKDLNSIGLETCKDSLLHSFSRENLVHFDLSLDLKNSDLAFIRSNWILPKKLNPNILDTMFQAFQLCFKNNK